MVSGIMIVMMLAAPTISVSASAKTTQAPPGTEVVYLENGDRIEFITSRQAPQTRAATSTYKVSQETRYVSGDKLLCSFTVIGFFEVNYGVSVKCVKTDYTTYTSGGMWRCENMSVTPNNSNSSLAVANGKVDFVKRLLGIKVDVQHVQISVSCNKYGQ